MTQDLETARIIGIKAALINTTSTPGWGIIKKMASNLVRNAANEALDEEDGSKRDAKVLKASALKKGLTELFNTIESTKEINTTTQDEAGFGELEIEYADEN